MSDCSMITNFVKIEPKNLFTAPQKCYLPREFIRQNKIKLGSLVICKCKQQNQQIICKVYSQNNKYGIDHCEINDCVRKYDINADIGSIVKSDGVDIEESMLMDLKFYTKELVIFSEIEIILNIEPEIFNQNIVKNNELQTIVLELLKFYMFNSNCLIDLDHKVNYGITKIFITNTSDKSSKQFGTVNENTNVIIKTKYFNTKNIAHKQLGGLNNVQHEINQFLEHNIKYQTNAEHISIRPCCQLLLSGAPGVGKTSLVHNIMSSNNNHICYEIRGYSIYKPHPGETEEELRNIFHKIKNFSTAMNNEYLSIVLIEDIEILCPKDIKGQDKSHLSRISYQVKEILDDVTANTTGIVIIATTSNIDSLAPDIRRPGRLEKEISIKMPSETDREEIMRILMGETFEQSEIKNQICAFVSKRTTGFVGADLEVLKENVLREIVKSQIKTIDCSLAKAMELFGNALKTTRPSVLRDSINISADLNQQGLNSIGGMKQLKKVLETSILGPLKHPDSFLRFGMKPLKGVLLYGPPGCAKTTLARCLAAETNMTFLSLSTAEIYSPYVGDSEKIICKLFNTARMSSPAIIFLDEIDTIAGNRLADGVKNQNVQTRILSTLLTEMDGIGVQEQNFASNHSNYILIVGATNRPELIDGALMRPGRFNKLIHVSAPDYESRLSILQIQEIKMPFNKNVDLQKLAEITINYSGADLCNLCNEAALQAISRDIDAATIDYDDFTKVLEFLKPSLKPEQIQRYYDFEKTIQVV